MKFKQQPVPIVAATVVPTVPMPVPSAVCRTIFMSNVCLCELCGENYSILHKTYPLCRTPYKRMGKSFFNDNISKIIKFFLFLKI